MSKSSPQVSDYFKPCVEDSPVLSEDRWTTTHSGFASQAGPITRHWNSILFTKADLIVAIRNIKAERLRYASEAAYAKMLSTYQRGLCYAQKVTYRKSDVFAVRKCGHGVIEVELESLGLTPQQVEDWVSSARQQNKDPGCSFQSMTYEEYLIRTRMTEILNETATA